MRTTLEICIAVKENTSVTELELRYALESMSTILRYVEHDLRDLSRYVIENKPLPIIKLRAKFARWTLKHIFYARKKPVDEWLGPNNLPGSPAQQRRLKAAKVLFKKVTGKDLENE